MLRMVKLLLLFLIFGSLYAQGELQEMEVKIQVVEKGVSAEPQAAKLLVKSTIPNLTFESNMGVKKSEKVAEGEWKLTLYPGNQRLTIKAAGYVSFSDRFSFENQKVYEVFVTSKSKKRPEVIDQKLFEITFELNVEEVYCAYGQFAPILSHGKKAIFKLPAGEYTFRFEKDQYRTVVTTIKVEQDKVVPIQMIADVTQRVPFRPPALVIIESNPAGAEILIGGQKFGNTPATLNLSAGEYELELRKPLYYPYVGKFTLTAGESKTVRQDLVPRFGYVSINSVPAGAEVFLNGISVGKTPIQKLPQNSGAYQLTVKLNNYYPYEEKFDLKDNEHKQLNCALKPAFGTLEIRSLPEDSAEVWIGEKRIGFTPYLNKEFPSGVYHVVVKKKYYFPSEEQVTVEDEKVTRRTYILNPSVGTLIVKAPEADIYLDAKYAGRGRIEEKLYPGTYKVTAEREKYYPQTREVSLALGEVKTLDIELEPKIGSLSVIVEPNEARNAELVLDNKYIGQAPKVITEIIGTYQLEAKAPGFLPESRKVTIVENQNIPVKFSLQTYEGSIKQKRDFWKRNQEISFTGSLIFAGLGYFFNRLAHNYYDQYMIAQNSDDAVRYRKKVESNYTLSLASFGISIGCLGSGIYCSVRYAMVE